MECPICLECDDQCFTTLKCNHMFHTKCIKIWLRNHNTCPYCRALVNIITVKIKRKTHKMFINPTNIVFKKNNIIIKIDFIKIKRIEYNGKKRITIFKKETDDTISKFKFFSKSGYYIFNTMKQYMS
jgi:hypothetical protein